MAFVLLIDNFLFGNLIKVTMNAPMIVFQNISNSYTILKEIEKTNVENIIFVPRILENNENLDYITNRVFRDLTSLGYNLDIKHIRNYKDLINV